MRICCQTEKLYLTVRADHLPDGSLVPVCFRLPGEEDVQIDRIVDAREAHSLRCGGQGMRYTCLIGANAVYLFHDQNKWFLEEG